VSELVSELVDDLRELFQDEEARHAYADNALNTTVAAQIKALREKQKMNQQKLAEAVGTKQSGISRLENVNYTTWNVETLRKLARAFDVRLRISFEEFGTLPDEIIGFRRNLTPRKFEDDPIFREKKVVCGTVRPSRRRFRKAKGLTYMRMRSVQGIPKKPAATTGVLGTQTISSGGSHTPSYNGSNHITTINHQQIQTFGAQYGS
jgi:transcriptional regulator with XRE-family HTH domain